jgi:hypothetical protein
LKIAILTRSYKQRNDKKTSGRCVAGITEEGKWIRLVADKDGDSLPPDNSTPFTKTVIDAEVVPSPLANQTENAILIGWKLLDESIKAYVAKLSPVNETFLFGNKLDRLNDDEIKRTKGSLRLVKVSDMKVYEVYDDIRRRVTYKCSFMYKENQYEKIAVTDPRFYTPAGVGSFGNATIVVSLPNSPIYMKFVAAIYLNGTRKSANQAVDTNQIPLEAPEGHPLPRQNNS